jgi:hypothetical protein
MHRIGADVKDRSNDLGAARVVKAGADDSLHGASRRVRAADRACGIKISGAASGSCGLSHSKRAVAAAAPKSWAAMNPGSSVGRIPATVLVAVRASVTAGFAKEVDAVKQQATVMYAPIANGIMGDALGPKEMIDKHLGLSPVTTKTSSAATDRGRFFPHDA